MNNLSLKIGKYQYQSWLNANIFLSMNAISGIAELKTINFFPGNIKDWDFTLGDSFQLCIDDQPVITGYMEHIEAQLENKQQFIKFILRDKTADLVDCNWAESVTEWKNQTVYNLVNTLCGEFAISLTSDSEVSTAIQKKIETFKINEGEFMSDGIFRICNPFDLIPLSYGDGKLILSKETSTKKSYDAIDTTGNVISRNAIYSDMDRFSDYIVKGMGLGTDQKNNYADYIQCKGQVSDSVIQRYRPKVIFDGVTDSGKCAEYAAWIKQVKAGQSRGKKYTVVGWVQTNGDVWKINRITRVYDPYLQLDKDMLISDVKFMYQEGKGHRTELTVVDKGTYTKTQSTIKSEFDS